MSMHFNLLNLQAAQALRHSPFPKPLQASLVGIEIVHIGPRLCFAFLQVADSGVRPGICVYEFYCRRAELCRVMVQWYSAF